MSGRRPTALVNGVEIPPFDPSNAIVLPNTVTFKMRLDTESVYRLIQKLVLPQLQHLELDNTPPDIILRLMASSDAILSTKIRMFPGDAGSSLPLHIPPSLSAPVSVPTLESLVSDCDINAASILDHLHTPSLTSLFLSNHDYSTPPYPLFRFIQRSNPPLLFLALVNVPINDVDLIQCFGMLSSLEKLRLYLSPISDAVLQALTEIHHVERDSENGSAMYLLPHLDFVWLEYSSNLTATEIVKFFVARSSLNQARPSCIARGNISGNQMEQDEIETLQSLGVNVF